MRASLSIALAAATSIGCASSVVPDAAHDGGGGADAVADAAPATSLGHVYVGDFSSPGNPDFAGTASVPTPSVPPIHVLRTDGPCVISHFTQAPTFDDAGALTVTTRTGTVTFMSGAGNYHFSRPDALWQPGDSLVVAAAGSVVPAFSAMLTYPEPLQLVSPTGSSVSIGSSGLTLTWQPTSADVGVQINAWTTAAGDSSVGGWCWFQGLSGSGTVPQSALTEAARMPHAGLNVFAAHHQLIALGTYAVDVIVENSPASFTFALTP